MSKTNETIINLPRMARLGCPGWAWQAWLGMAGSGKARQGVAGSARHG